jgi:hypothetical protein
MTQLRAFSAFARETRERATADAPKRRWRVGGQASVLATVGVLVVATAACSRPSKHVRILILPEQGAAAAAQRERLALTDIVFKKNASGKTDEHPFFYRDNDLRSHGDGCENPITISISLHEEVVWEAAEKFQILDIAKSKCGTYQMQELAPANPFYGAMPYSSTGAAPFVVHSGEARPESVNQLYKIKIKIISTGEILDPDIFCMS